MDWTPFSETEITNLIDSAYKRMSVEQKRVWENVKIAPRKWSQDPWGNEGKGFWVVGLVGRTVVWFNDIEEGLNRSTYIEYGRIDEYWCKQSPEVRERAVRLVFDSQKEDLSQWAAIQSIADKIGCTHDEVVTIAYHLFDYGNWW